MHRSALLALHACTLVTYRIPLPKAGASGTCVVVSPLWVQETLALGVRAGEALHILDKPLDPVWMHETLPSKGKSDPTFLFRSGGSMLSMHVRSGH